MNQESPRGVGGWLLFFCFVLTIFTPVRLLMGMGAAGKLSDQTKSLYPNFSNAVLIGALVCLVLVVMSIRAGVLLWREKKEAVAVAQRFLVWLVVYSTASIGLAYVGNLPAAAQVVIRNAYFAAAVQTLVFALVWHQYLSRSKRVANTFTR
jgi:uncharacterized protein DUF2569